MTAASPVYRIQVPMPKTVLAFGLTSSASEIVQEVAGRGRVSFFNDVADVETQLLSVAEASLVVGVPADANEKQCEAIIALRQKFPNAPMVAIFFPSSSSCRAILRLGAAGVSQIVTGEPLIRRDDLTLALSRSHGEGVAIRLWRSCDFVFPDPFVPVLKAALRLAHRPITAESLGDSTGMHERSLRKYCAQHALPSPQWIIGWARLLVAGYYLDEPGRTVAQVAHMLDFPSACALRNQLKRYSALASRSLRASGTTITIGRRLEDAVAAHQLTATGSPSNARDNWGNSNGSSSRSNSD